MCRLSGLCFVATSSYEGAVRALSPETLCWFVRMLQCEPEAFFESEQCKLLSSVWLHVSATQVFKIRKHSQRALFTQGGFPSFFCWSLVVGAGGVPLRGLVKYDPLMFRWFCAFTWTN